MQEFKYKKASVHGRFQLLHNDHLDYILKAKAQTQHLIIGITSYNIRELIKVDSAPHRFYPKNNPLTYYERSMMVTEALIDEGVHEGEFSFTPFPIEIPQLIPDFVPTSIPCFTTIREEWNKNKIENLRKIGFDVIVLKEELTKEIEGTKIRNLIIEGNEVWKKMVPQATINSVLRLNVRDRLLQ